MKRLVFALVVALAMPTRQQSAPISPCPNVFSYEPPGSEPGRWYGVVNLSTDSTLHSLWLNIVLDTKADILGNWVGDVSTTDNIDFKIENTEMKINPGPAIAVRFFVQYNPLNKTPKLQAIRLNGREICNANTPQPAVERPDRESSNSRPTRPPTTSRPVTTQSSVIRPEDRPQTRPTQSRPGSNQSQGDRESPVYVRPGINTAIPSSIDGGNNAQNVNPTYVKPTQRPNNYYTTSPPVRTTSTRRYEIPDFDGESDNVSNGDRADSADYFSGGSITFTVPNGGSSTNSNNKRPQSQPEQQCGKVTLNNPIPLVVNGTPTLEGQWPWQIALYQTQTVDNKYICGGTLVSHKHILTAAHCVTLKGSKRAVNKNTLTVYLGKHNLRTSVDGVQIKFVERILVHPDYNATIFSRDLAILELKEPVTYSDWVRPACLWPDNQVDLNNVVGKRGSVVGWGYDESGVATEELTLVEMPIVDQETCLRSYSEFFTRFTSNYTYCAGFRDGTSVCNGDSGGGMVFKLGSTWYVRGLVSVSVARENEYRCDPHHYVIFTDLAKFLPWIRQHVNDY